MTGKGVNRVIDLVGRTFERWTVIEFAGKTNAGAAKWKCVCSCEAKTERIITANALKAGQTKSCGCYHDEVIVGRLEPGQKFGHWTVIERAERPDGMVNRNAYWKVRCDCPAKTEKVVQGAALRNGGSTSCGCERNRISGEWQRSHRGALHPNWKGGGWENVHGYREIMENGKQVLEHRSVMEHHLGRKLLPTEIVHHKNGIRVDNRIDNLEICKDFQPPGQRVTDATEDEIDKMEPGARAELLKRLAERYGSPAVV